MGFLTQQAALQQPSDVGGGGGGGFFGIHLPHINLGLTNALHMALGFPGAMLGIGEDFAGFASGDEEAGRRLASIGEGFTSSVVGTAGDILSAATLGQGRGLINRAEKPIANALSFGNEQNATSNYEAMHPFKQGIVPGLLTDIGNASLVGSVGGALARAGELGATAEAARTAGVAEAAGITPETIASRAASVSDANRALSKVPILRRLSTTSPEMRAAGEVGAFDYSKVAPILRKAADAAAKAEGITTTFDEGAVAQRIRVLEAMDKLAHPVGAGIKGVRQLGKAAQDLATASRVPDTAGGFRPITFDELTAEGAATSRPVSAEEFQQIAQRGTDRIAKMTAEGSPPEALDANWQQVIDHSYEQAQGSWGGATFDAHTGQPVSPTEGLATTIKEPGVDTISMPENATKAEFTQKMNEARQTFAPQLEANGGHLGIFHDDTLHEIQIDPVAIAADKTAAEELSAASHSVGGAYDYATGNGHFAPHVADPEAMARAEQAAAPPVSPPVHATPGEDAPYGVPPEQVAATQITEAIAPRTGPIMAAQLRAAAEPLSPTARRMIEVLPESARKFLASFEGKMQARDVRMVANEERRFVQSARLATLHGPAMRESVAAGNLLVGKTMPDGTVLDEAGADRLITLHIQNQYNGRQMIAHALTNGASAELRAFIERKMNQATPIPPELLTDELKTHLDAAGVEWDKLAQQRLGELLGSRRGGEGLGLANRDERLPIPEGLSPAQAKEFRAIERMYEAIEKRNQPIADKALEVARADILKKTDKISALEAGAATMGERIDAQRQVVLDQALPEAIGSGRVEATAGRIATEADRVQNLTYDPHTDEFVVSGAATTPPPEDLFRPTPLDGKPGTFERFAVSTEGGRQVPTELWATDAPAIIQQFISDHAATFANADAKLSVHVDGNTVHLDVTQTTINGRYMNEGQAYILATARNQGHYFDFASNRATDLTHDPMARNVAAQHVESLFKYKSQLNRYLRQQANVMRDLGIKPQLGPGNIPITAADMNGKTQLFMNVADYAVRAGTAKSIEGFWAQHEIEIRRSATQLPVGALLQTYLNRPLTMETVLEAEKYLGKDSQVAADWYHEQHAFVEKTLAGVKVPIYNVRTGVVESWDATELLYSVAAVTSKNSGPLQNAANAFSALANYVDYVQMNDLIHDFAPKIKAYADEVAAHVASGKRMTAESPFTANELFQRLTRKGVIAHMNDVRHDVMEVLSGRPVSEFDNEYLRTRLTAAGETRAGRERLLNPRNLSEREVMEQAGSTGYAKIRSFYENLKSPETSMGVTLDRVMAELIGLNGGNWNAKGAYAEAAAKLRAVADEYSVMRYGEIGHVQAHQMQALLWAFSKKLVNANDIGRLHAAIGDSLDAIDAGTWSAKSNPIRDMMEGDIAFGETTPPPKGKLAAIPGREVQVRNVGHEGVGTIPEVRATPTETETHFHKFAAADRKLIRTQLDVVKYDKGRPQSWAAIEKEVQASIDRGDIAGARRRISGYLGTEGRRYTNDPQGFDIADGSAKKASFRANVVQRLKDAGLMAKSERELAMEAQTQASNDFLGDAVFQKFHDDGALGATYTSTKTGRTVTAFFQSADVTTLFHESAHALRQFVPAADLQGFERAYGAKVGTAAFEEAFATDFITYMHTREASPALAGSFARVQSVLSTLWESVRGTFMQTIDPGVASVLDKWFAPETTASAPDISVYDPTTNLDRSSLAQITAHLPARQQPGTAGQPAPETPQEALRRGAEAARATTRAAWQSEGRQRLLRTRDSLVKARDGLRAQIEAESLPEQRALAKATSRADARAARFEAAYNVPANRQVPAAWVPLWSDLNVLHDFAAKSADPELAQVLAEFPRNFEALVAKAKEISPGFSPTHFANLSEAEVRRFTYDPIKMLDSYQRSGVLAEKAGTRNVRTTGLNRTETLAAMIGAQVAVTHEAATGQIVDLLDATVRRAIPTNEKGEPVIPAGWRAYDGMRRFLLTGKKDAEGGYVLAGAQTQPQWMVPDAVDRTIREMSHNYSHPIFHITQKVLSPWRTLILTTNPGFYAHVFVSNAIMATAQGVTLEDWVNAVVATSGEKPGKLGAAARWLDAHRLPRWADLSPEDLAASHTVGGSYPYPRNYSDERSLVSGTPRGIHPIKQFKAGRAGRKLSLAAPVEADTGVGTIAGKVTRELQVNSSGIGEVRASLQKAGQNVHDFARTAVYLSGVRSGMSTEEALMRSYTAMVDYNDMNSFEQNIVKSIVPFYAWQKGLLKVTAQFALDHPLRAAIILHIGKMNETYNPNTPDAYAGVVRIPGTNVNLNLGKMAMPWTDSLKLLTPEGIMEQANPLVTSLLENGLGAATGGRVHALRVDPLGHAVPDTSPMEELTQNITGAPIFRGLAGVAGGPMGALGVAPATGGKQGVPAAVGNFFGLGSYSNAQIQAFRDRVLKSEATIASGHQDIYTDRFVKKPPRIKKGQPGYKARIRKKIRGGFTGAQDKASGVVLGSGK